MSWILAAVVVLSGLGLVVFKFRLFPRFIRNRARGIVLAILVLGLVLGSAVFHNLR